MQNPKNHDFTRMLGVNDDVVGPNDQLPRSVHSAGPTALGMGNQTRNLVLDFFQQRARSGWVVV